MSDFRGCQSRVDDTPLRLGQITLNHAAMTDLDTFGTRSDPTSSPLSRRSGADFSQNDLFRLTVCPAYHVYQSILVSN